jgi:uncharacterized membrane protein
MILNSFFYALLKGNQATVVAVDTFSCTVYTETSSFFIFQEIFRKVSNCALRTVYLAE